MIQLLYEAKDLLCTFLSNVFKRDVLPGTADILQVEYTGPDNQVSDEKLDVGTAARRHISTEDVTVYKILLQCIAYIPHRRGFKC